MSPEQRVILNYVLAALAGAVIATGLQLSVTLAGTDPVLLRPLASTFTATLFGALATAYGASRLVRPGSAAIAAQVDTLRAEGVHRSDMLVVDATDPTAVPMTAADIDRLAEAVLRKNREATAPPVLFGDGPMRGLR